jgi:tetratricopeptide (TPR) repeat protein
MGLGRNKDALACAEKALSLNAESAEANDLMGGTLSVLNSFPEALPFLEKAVKLEPQNASFLLNLCSTYDMAKEHNKAIDTCSLIINKHDSKFLGEELYVRARAYQAVGRKKGSFKGF